MWSILTCILLFSVCVILFWNRPLALMFFNTKSLPMYLASRITLEMLQLENTKENRRYIRKMCCTGHKFSEDFLDYASNTFGTYDIEGLGIVMYEYISFKEKMKEVHDESD